MPKFHRLQREQIVALDEWDRGKQWRKNDRADWVQKRDAHQPLIDRATFDAVQERMAARPAMPRGHSHEYLLSGTLACSCGEVMTGQTRIRKKELAAGEHTYEDPIYVCAGGLRAKGICRQIGLPRDASERAVLRVLDEEVFAPEGLDLLEAAIRRECDLRRAVPRVDAAADLERRERELAQRVAAVARRILSVDESVVGEVRAALNEAKADLERVRATLEAARRATPGTVAADDVIAALVGPMRSMATILRDPGTPLNQRREFLRRFLPPGPNGVRPIQVEFDLKAERGWRNSLRRVTIRHLSVRGLDAAKVTSVTGAFASASATNVVAGAVAAEGGLADIPGEGVTDALPVGARDLGWADLEAARSRPGFAEVVSAVPTAVVCGAL